MPYIALNNAASTLSGGVSNVAVSIPVQVGHGARFVVGANYSYVTLQDAPGNIEVVKLTGVSDDVLTVVRAQDGTAARAWAIGDVISCRPCTAAFNDFAVAPQVNTSTSKVTPVDADELGLADSAATYGLKKLTWANLKATLVTYLNGLYAKVGANSDITSLTALTAPTVAANPLRAADLQAQTVTAFTTGGTSSAFTLTPTPASAANAAKQQYTAILNAAPTGSPTIAVSGLTALNFKYWDPVGTKRFVTSTQAPINYPAIIYNDGTDWMLLNPVRKSAVAWVNFNGNSPGTIRASFNVSSITYNSAGNYAVNFTVALADTNYAAVSNTANNAVGSLYGTVNDINRTTSGLQILTSTGGDAVAVDVVVFR